MTIALGSTADAHESLLKVEILYPLATTDRIPVYMELNSENVEIKASLLRQFLTSIRQ